MTYAWWESRCVELREATGCTDITARLILQYSREERHARGGLLVRSLALTTPRRIRSQAGVCHPGQC